MDPVGRVFLLRNAFILFPIFLRLIPGGYPPDLAAKCPSHLLFDAARAALVPDSSATLSLALLILLRSKSTPASSLSRTHTLGKVGSRSRAAGFSPSPPPPLPPLIPFLLLLFRERVSTRVNEMPRRRPLAVVSGRSINLQVQAATALCGRHSCPLLVYFERERRKPWYPDKRVWLLSSDYTI